PQCLRPLKPSYRVAVHPEAFACNPFKALPVLKRFASGARRVGSKESQEAGRADAIVGQRALREGRASALTTGQSREAAWTLPPNIQLAARDWAMLLSTSHRRCRWVEMSFR